MIKRGQRKPIISHKRGEKGQLMGMPFQFLFAIILIVIVVFVGFYVIKMFLERAEQARINDFVKNQLEYEVQRLWSGPEEASETKTFTMSNKIKAVCFFNQNLTEAGTPSCRGIASEYDFCSEYEFWLTNDDKTDNFFLLPFGIAEKYGSFTTWKIKCNGRDCIYLRNILTRPVQNVNNPLCFEVDNGALELKFTKDSTTNYLVKIESVS
jgi:hypothetical protein